MNFVFKEGTHSLINKGVNMAKGKERKMTRQEADELYRDLKTAMDTMKKRDAAQTVKPASPNKADADVAKEIAAAIKQGMAKDVEAGGFAAEPAASKQMAPSFPQSHAKSTSYRGQFIAISLVVTFAVVKIVLSGLEASGLATVKDAEASYVQTLKTPTFMSENYTRQEVQILTSLDVRRKELEGRRKKLDERTLEVDRRDREFASKLTQLRELTEKLKANRVKNDRKRSGQLDQLANVYGSMNPKGSAELIEQLDITIALSLLERMPEKRIGQILALMSPERALALTRMLSGGVR